MTRLANLEKAGYFAIPPSVTELILSYVRALQGGRILDPCAGEGTALVTLARALHLEPYGVELHEGRAQAARQLIVEMLAQRGEENLDSTARVLNDSYQSLTTSRDGYNFLYLNPPYDYDNEDGRLEYQWLWRCRPWLQPGGLLVWVVPQHLLKFRKATRYVLSHFKDIRVYRFPDDTYEQFHQIVLFGMRRRKATTPEAEAVDKLRALAAGKEALAPLAAVEEPAYILPPLAVRDGAFTFRSMFVRPEEALAEAAQYGAGTTEEWRRHLDPAMAHARLGLQFFTSPGRSQVREVNYLFTTIVMCRRPIMGMNQRQATHQQPAPTGVVVCSRRYNDIRLQLARSFPTLTRLDCAV